MSEAIAYAIEIARALGAAHDSQIVHRDVKPQNVLVDEEGAAKVTDFGIARSLAQEGLTADGRVLGTTDYVSPEQALGHAVSGQSDLYSLGIVLFEMLTGDVPFKGDNQVAVAMKHVREELPDVQIRRPEVSAALAAVLDRATAKELDRRYPDAASLIIDLEDVLAIETSRSGGQVTGEATAVLRSLPAGTRKRLPLRARRSTKALVALLAIAGLTALAVTLGLGLRRPSAGPASARTSRRRPPGWSPSRSASARRATSTRSATSASTPTRRAPSSTACRPRRGRPRATAADCRRPASGSSSTPRRASRRGAWTCARRPPGFEATIYAAPDATPATAPPQGWTPVSATRIVCRDEKFELDTDGQGVPPLPRLDHASCRRSPSAPRSPRSCCSSSRPGELRPPQPVRTRTRAPARGARSPARTGA